MCRVCARYRYGLLYARPARPQARQNRTIKINTTFRAWTTVHTFPSISRFVIRGLCGAVMGLCLGCGWACPKRRTTTVLEAAAAFAAARLPQARRAATVDPSSILLSALAGCGQWMCVVVAVVVSAMQGGKELKPACSSSDAGLWAVGGWTTWIHQGRRRSFITLRVERGPNQSESRLSIDQMLCDRIGMDRDLFD